MIHQLLNIFFPQKCFSCGRMTDSKESSFHLLCTLCAEDIKPIRTQNGTKCRRCSSYLYDGSIDLCYNCSQASFSFRRNTSLFYYKDPLIRNLMHQFKFNSNRLAGLDISNILKYEIQNYLNANSYDDLIIAPLSRESLRKRGFNQVEYILEKCKIDFKNILIREKHSKHQSELTAEERKDWIKGQFKIGKESIELIKGKSLLLIDDIFTTGNTANEISTVLMNNGASLVDILTFFKD